MFEFVPKTCQWIDPDKLDGECRLPTVVGKSYCEHHYPRAYQLVATDEIDEVIDMELATVDATVGEVAIINED